MRRRRLLLVAVAVVVVTGLFLQDCAAGPSVDPAAGPEVAGARGVPSTSPGDSGEPRSLEPGDDGRRPSPGPSGRPSTPAQPAAVTTAEAFAAVWSSHRPDWLDRLAELATPELLASLSGVDPAAVPARTVTGPGQVVLEVAGWVSVGVPTDAGTVVLQVVQADGDWLVSSIDWRPR